MPVLLSPAYFPPVEYFAVMAKGMTRSKPSGHSFYNGLPVSYTGADGRIRSLPRMHGNIVPEQENVIPGTAYIEACENYQKQTYRNRCVIYSECGPQTLNFPVVHDPALHNVPVRDVRIDYSVQWVIRHKRAIESAYRTSAYFDYYADDIFAILDARPERLYDLDLAITRYFIDKAGLSVELRETTEYHLCRSGDECGEDYRDIIHPKRKNDILRQLGLNKPYFQVFARKYGFIPNLSIMDLLFNEGPDSLLFLKKSF